MQTSIIRKQVTRPSNQHNRTITVVIINYRTSGLTIDCVRSLASEVVGGECFRVVLVDNASPDDSANELKEAIQNNRWESWVHFIQAPLNGGFAYGNNLGIRDALQENAELDYILLLNPDTVVRPGAIRAIRQFMDKNPDVGIAGSRLENPDGTSQCAARRFPGILSEFESSACTGPISRFLTRWIVSPPEIDEPHACDWLPGASLCVRREVFESIGLLDEDYFMYFEEVDFCLRAKRAGWHVWYVPESRVVHLVGQSSGVTSISGEVKRLPKYWFASRRRYFEKNFGIFAMLLANVACISGLIFSKIRNVIHPRRSPHAPRMLSDLMAYELQSWRRRNV